jgi:hypothetical protein
MVGFKKIIPYVFSKSGFGRELEYHRKNMALWNFFLTNHKKREQISTIVSFREEPDELEYSLISFPSYSIQ